ncbi:hypothetical protein D9M72_436860 [compost metagenome]
MVRRRRDQAHARHGIAQAGDQAVDLAAGQLAALAGLGALGHLDLQHVGIDKILGGHAEAARRDLLDARTFRVRRAIGQRQVAVAFLAAFAGVRLAADPVHGDCERRMRLAADRAEGHSTGREALDDVGSRLDLVDRDRLAAESLGALHRKQAANGVHA